MESLTPKENLKQDKTNTVFISVNEDYISLNIPTNKIAIPDLEGGKYLITEGSFVKNLIKSIESFLDLNSKYFTSLKTPITNDGFKTVDEETPPMGLEILVKHPDGTVALSSYRPEYGIFSCQSKGDNTNNWTWKRI